VRDNVVSEVEVQKSVMLKLYRLFPDATKLVRLYPCANDYQRYQTNFEDLITMKYCTSV